MPRMMVGLVNTIHQKSTANNIDEGSLLAQAEAIKDNADEALLLAKAAAIMSNPDSVLDLEGTVLTA